MSTAELQESPYVDINELGITPENAGRVIDYLKIQYGNRVVDAMGMITSAAEFAATRRARPSSTNYIPSVDNPMDVARFLFNMNERANLLAALHAVEQTNE